MFDWHHEKGFTLYFDLLISSKNSYIRTIGPCQFLTKKNWRPFFFRLKKKVSVVTSRSRQYLKQVISCLLPSFTAHFAASLSLSLSLSCSSALCWCCCCCGYTSNNAMQSPASSSSCAAILLLLAIISFCFRRRSGAEGNKTRIKISRENEQTERKKERKIHPLLSFLIALPTFCVFLSFHRVFVLSGRARERASLLCFVIFKRVRDGDTSNWFR